MKEKFDNMRLHASTMDSRLSFLLVLASVAQSAYVPTFEVYYGLSEKQVAVLNKTMVNEYWAGVIYNNAMKSLFEVIFELDTHSDTNCSKAFEAIAGMEKAVNLTLDTVVITIKEPCCAVEEARKASSKDLLDAAAEIRAACKLATHGDYEKNRDAIEVHRTATLEYVKKTNNQIYHVISTCLDTRDPDALAVIRNAHNQSYQGIDQTNYALFNAIKLRAAVVTDGCPDRHFISDIEDLEDKALFGTKQNVEYRFSILSTFYMYACLNKKGILPQLAANQYAVRESLRGYQEGDNIIFFAILRYLKYLQLGITNNGKLDLSRDDVDVIKEIAHYDAGDSSNLAYIRLLHPESADKIAAIGEIIFDINDIGSHGLYDLIHAAIAPGANYSEVMANIETARTKIGAIAQNFTESYFTIVRNDQNFDEELDTELEKLLEESIDYVLFSVSGYINAIEVLANATHIGKVSKDDFSAILAFRDDTSEGNNKLTQGISTASILVLLAQNNNKK